MKGNVFVAGFVLTADEWEDLETVERLDLIAIPLPAPRPARAARASTADDRYEAIERAAAPA